jgi:ParB/RepB/Spo0J family partition protein
VDINRLQDGSLFVRSNEKLDDLIESMRAEGFRQLDAAIVTPVGDKYSIIHGHRRVHAARMAQIEQIPVRIVKGKDVNRIAADEFRHQGFSPMEEAEFFHRWIDNLKLSEKELGKLIKRSPEFISTRKRLATGLDSTVKEMVRQGKVSPSKAEIIAQLPIQVQLEFAEVVRKKRKWSVSRVQREVSNLKGLDSISSLSIQLLSGPLKFDTLTPSLILPGLTPAQVAVAREMSKRLPPQQSQYFLPELENPSKAFVIPGVGPVYSHVIERLRPIFRILYFRCEHCGKRITNPQVTLVEDDRKKVEHALERTLDLIRAMRPAKVKVASGNGGDSRGSSNG